MNEGSLLLFQRTLGRRLHYETVYKLRADQGPLIQTE